MKSRHHGFSLLEAVVAMVLISGAGYAVFGWINTNIMALSRIHESNARSAATQNVLEYMSGVNPMQKSEGTVSLGEYTVRWQSKPITLVQDGDSLYQLALYDTLVQAERGETTRWLEFHIRQVGYKKVREVSPL